MGSKKRYKIKKGRGKILGPLDISEIKLLVHNNELKGTEDVSEFDKEKWKAFGSFPELYEIVIEHLAASKKIELGETDKQPAKADKPEEKLDKPEVKNESDENTQTGILEEETDSDLLHQEPAHDEDDFDFGAELPTIIIKKETEQNVDLEQTKIIPKKQVPQLNREEETRVLSSHAKLPVAKKKGDQDEVIKDSLEVVIRKSVLSKKSAILIGVLILLVTVFKTTTVEEKKENALEEIRPKLYKFDSRQLQVKMPKLRGKKPQVAESTKWLNRGVHYFDKDSMDQYILAARALYKSIAYNPSNVVARSLLASAYIRLADVLPRNESLLNAITDLLKVRSKQDRQNIYYIQAKAEFLIMMQKPMKAMEMLHVASKKAPRPSLLYLQAIIYKDRGEKNKAINLINRAIKIESSSNPNPNFSILLAQLLEEKGRRDSAIGILKASLRDSPRHGLTIYEYANLLFKSGKKTAALSVIIKLIKNPRLVDRQTLANVFVLTARILEAEGKYKKAFNFAVYAKRILPENQPVRELILKIRSKNPNTSELYSRILRAKQKEKAKQYQDAVNLYIQSREFDRRDPTPLYYLASLYKDLGNFEQSISYFKRSIEMRRKYTDSYLELAELYLNIYDLERAVSMLKRAVRANKSPMITYLRGKVALRRNDPINARAHFQRAISSRLRSPGLYIQVADLEFAANNKRLAEFYYSVALRYRPLDENALLGLALCRFHLDTPSSTISFLKRKLYDRPNSSAIMTNLALLYVKSGNRVLGKEYLTKAIKNNPQYSRALKLLGDFAKEEGDVHRSFAEKRRSYKLALTSYRAYSRLEPNDPEGHMASANLYYFVRDLGAAAKAYQRVLELAPNYPRVRLQLAKIARNGKNPDRALELIKEEIKRHPNTPDAHNEMGNIYLAKNDLVLAAGAYSQSAQLKENNTMAIIGLAYVNYQQGNFEYAVKLFERAVAIEPLNADTHWKLALALEKNGNKEKAIVSYKNFRGLIRSRDPVRAKKAAKRIQYLRKR